MILLWPHFPEVVSEAVTSLTDRLTGANAQQRIALNPQPMQGLSFQWGLGGVEAGAAEALYRSNPLGDWYVPFWPDALLVGALSAGVTSIACDASQRDYRPGGFVAVLDDFGNAEVAPLVSADASGITIGSGLVNDYSAAWVAPALVGHAPDGLFVTRTDSHFQTASISFRIRETADLGASTYDTFEGDPVLHDHLRRSGVGWARSLRSLLLIILRTHRRFVLKIQGQPLGSRGGSGFGTCGEGKRRSGCRHGIAT